MKKLDKITYWVLSCTWGIIETLIGAIVALALLITGHKPHIYHYDIYFEVGKNWGGFELGPFFVCNENPSEHLKQHEHGHGFQNCWWGPLYPIVIGIPSAIRYWYREIEERIMDKKLEKGKITSEQYREWFLNRPAYDDMWFEGQASALGKEYFGL